MNERIFELAKQAGFIEEDGGNNLHVFDGYEAITCTEELKKFSELLIKECATVCDEIAEMAEITNTGEVARKTKATAVSCSNFIKNRFGVKS
jgi:hypothetical protein